MMFHIAFIDKNFHPPEPIDEGGPWALGQIRLGDHRETFWSSLELWRVEDYEKQWVEAIQRCRQRMVRSCFVVSVVRPSIEIWPVWLVDDDFRVQNRFVRLEKEFYPGDLYEIIGTYREVNEDGEKLACWRLPSDAFD